MNKQDGDLLDSGVQREGWMVGAADLGFWVPREDVCQVDIANNSWMRMGY